MVLVKSTGPEIYTLNNNMGIVVTWATSESGNPWFDSSEP